VSENLLQHRLKSVPLGAWVEAVCLHQSGWITTVAPDYHAWLRLWSAPKPGTACRAPTGRIFRCLQVS